MCILTCSTSNVSSGQPMAPGCFHQRGRTGDPVLPYRPVYPPRMIPLSPSSVSPPPPHQPYLYQARLVSHPPHAAASDYYPSLYGYPSLDSNYTCVGAPIRPGFPPGLADIGSSRLGSDSDARDRATLQHSSQEDGSSCGRSVAGSTHQRLSGF